MCVHKLTRMTVSELCILQDKRRKTKDGQYPVRIYVYVTRDQRDYIPTPYSLTEKEYSQLHVSKKLRVISNGLSQMLSEVEHHLKEIGSMMVKK